MSSIRKIPSLGEKVVGYDYRCYGRIEVIFESGKVISIPVTLEDKKKFMDSQETNSNLESIIPALN
jgi:hypothetical protein